MAVNCVFCDIVSGKQPTEFIYEDDEMLIFEDIKPAAKYHYLAIPKNHIKDVKVLTNEHKQLVEKLVNVGKKILQEKGCDVNDMRMGFHVPPFNSVSHLHLHLITPASEMNFLSRMIFKANTWWFATVEYILENFKDELPINN